MRGAMFSSFKDYEELLLQYSRPSPFYERIDEDKLRCLLCGHRCVIGEGRRGVCLVRYVRNGKLMAPWGYVSALNNDPIEKKPLFHVLPTEKVLSFGMLGCNFRCPFCQNWEISQTLRDPQAIARIVEISPEDIVSSALRLGDVMIASTYNEPIITTEWAIDIFKLARERGMLTIYVTNGFGSPELPDILGPYLDAANIDLKSFQDKNYRKLGGRLEPVLSTIEAFVRRGIWVEVTTLVVPGFNDDPKELEDIASFLASISKDIPWHVTAFHPDYKELDKPRTPTSKLIEAYEIGRKHLNYVYMGNVLAEEYETTYCPNCGAPVISRAWYRVENHMKEGGKCPRCGYRISGIWRGGYSRNGSLREQPIIKLLPQVDEGVETEKEGFK